MSLQTRLEAFAAALGADTKRLRDSNPIVQAGFLGATFDPLMIQNTLSMSSTNLQLVKIQCLKSGTVNNLWCAVGTAGASLTYARMALFSSAGVQLGITVDLSSSFTSTKTKSPALTTPVSVTEGTSYFLGVLQVGTTPALLYKASSAVDSMNSGSAYAAAPFRYSYISGQSTMPASFNPASVTAGVNAWWLAMG